MQGAAFGGDSRGESIAVSAEVVRAHLARILISPDFDASERNRRFLSHVVDEALAGRGERIKAYGIAIAVFDRDDSFDPQSDPIVRIEASRLRRSLERYYLLAGKDDPVRIEIPKGGYLPVFHRQDGGMPAQPLATPSERPDVPPPVFPRRPRFEHIMGPLLVGLGLLAAVALVVAASVPWLGHSPSAEPGPVVALRQGPAILVAPFEDDGSQGAHPGLSQGFTREVIAGLTRFSDLFVFGAETAFRHGGAVDSRGLAAELDVDFILAGGVSASSDRFQVTASLIDAQTGQYVWSGKFGGSLAAAEIIKTRDDLADRIVRELAQPYGVIFDKKAMEIQGRPPQAFTSDERFCRSPTV